MDIDRILTEREKTHGSWPEVADVYEELRAVIYGHLSNPATPNTITAAIDMICMKLARIACGDPMHPDHWIDLGTGYPGLVLRELEKGEDHGDPH